MWCGDVTSGEERIDGTQIFMMVMIFTDFSINWIREHLWIIINMLKLQSSL